MHVACDRAPLRLVALGALLGASLAMAPVRAQSQTIVDPELAGSVPSETIEDPELAPRELATKTPAPAVTTIAAPSEQSADLRVVLRSRVGVDLAWDEPREDVIEATQLVLFEARVRRSERLAFTLGVRARHFTATRERSTPEANAARFELDAAPTALYADVALTDSVHTRVGYQGVHLGRFDALGASDTLSRYDLRAGPTVMPEQSEIAQPAITLDWDFTSALALRAIYVPFFAPHWINVFDGDYALSPSSQADLDAANAAGGSSTLDESTAVLLRSALSRSGQARFFEGGFAAFAPDPNLAQPQAAARLSAHGGPGEVAITASSALEHLPELQVDRNSGVPSVHYRRFAVLSADAATDVGPVQVGVELAYALDRTLFITHSGGVPLARDSDVAQAALRAEWIDGEHWIVAAEASGAYMIADPPPSEKWLFTTGDRFQIAAVGFIARTAPSLGLTLELAGGVLNGPTYLFAPRIELRMLDELFVECGAYVVGGGGPRDLSQPTATLGRVYETTDQVFVGLRWLP